LWTTEVSALGRVAAKVLIDEYDHANQVSASRLSLNKVLGEGNKFGRNSQACPIAYPMRDGADSFFVVQEIVLLRRQTPQSVTGEKSKLQNPRNMWSDAKESKPTIVGSNYLRISWS